MYLIAHSMTMDCQDCNRGDLMLQPETIVPFKCQRWLKTTEFGAKKLFLIHIPDIAIPKEKKKKNF